MGVPLRNLKARCRELQTELGAAVGEVRASAAFIGGPKFADLERAIAEFCGPKHAVVYVNGTDALFPLMASLGIGRGDEIITTPFGCASNGPSLPVAESCDGRTFALQCLPGITRAQQEAVTGAPRGVGA